MIKKFKEYNESISLPEYEPYSAESVEGRTLALSHNAKKLRGIISIEEVEDQFLRLKEILHYAITITEQRHISGYRKGIFLQYDTTFYHVSISPYIFKGDKDGVDEVNQVVERMKNIYPDLNTELLITGHAIIGATIELKNPKPYAKDVKESISYSDLKDEKINEDSDFDKPSQDQKDITYISDVFVRLEDLGYDINVTKKLFPLNGVDNGFKIEIANKDISYPNILNMFETINDGQKFFETLKRILDQLEHDYTIKSFESFVVQNLLCMIITKRDNKEVKESNEITNENISSIILHTDIEDQFLWLEEVIGCRIEISQSSYDGRKKFIGKSWRVLVEPPKKLPMKKYDQIYNELFTIKKRIEIIYPNVEVVLPVERGQVLSNRKNWGWMGAVLFIKNKNASLPHALISKLDSLKNK